MKVAVTGAGGMLGKSLVDHISKKKWVNLFAFDSTQLDVTDILQVQSMLSSIKPEIVIHLAAKTDVDECELHPEEAYRVNYLGTRYICYSCSAEDIALVYLSSDMIFDGSKNSPYIETDSPSPQNIYGKTKYAGEKVVELFVKRHYIIRSAWLFGGQHDHKFVRKFLNRVKDRQPLKAAVDLIGSPTYTEDLAAKIVEIIEEGYPWGTYHVVNQGLCSRYEFAQHILTCIKYESAQVEPVPSSFFKLPAPRAGMSALQNYTLTLMNKNDLRPWQDALEQYLKRFKKNI